jgi:formylglycine-generating enzyme required for sulfatase activity
VPPFLSALSVAILITACGSTARRLDASSPGLLDLGDDAVTSPELDTIARDAGLGPSLDSNEDDVGAPGFDGQPYGVDATGGNHGCELQCGSASCCASLLVPGGTMTRTEDILDGGVAVETVAPFFLDKFEVTVGRFRAFVEAYDEAKPADGAGAHPLIPQSGWSTTYWDRYLPASKSDLVAWIHCQNYPRSLPSNIYCPECDCGSTEDVTWTDEPGSHETFPVDFVNWYMAFAFCAWDGGRLPTEAEWEFAAAGGDERRVYPWGNDSPTAERANYHARSDLSTSVFVAVGSTPLGDGRWGHSDLAGSVWEWVLDYSSTSLPATCDNCANLEPYEKDDYVWRVVRGGGWSSWASEIRVAFRGTTDEPGHPPTFAGPGFRCARDGVKP